MIRFARVIWWLSLLVLGFATAAWWNPDNNQGISIFLVLGWPAFIGFIFSYVVSGTLGYPTEKGKTV